MVLPEICVNWCADGYDTQIGDDYYLIHLGKGRIKMYRKVDGIFCFHKILNPDEDYSVMEKIFTACFEQQNISEDIRQRVLGVNGLI